MCCVHIIQTGETPALFNIIRHFCHVNISDMNTQQKPQLWKRMLTSPAHWTSHMLAVPAVSAVFDSVDHIILLHRLRQSYRITGMIYIVIAWQTSVCLIWDKQSPSCCVHHGFILGPLLFICVLPRFQTDMAYVPTFTDCVYCFF